jgi:preprotein translocase subunit SecA
VRNKFLVDLKTDEIAEGSQAQVTDIITDKVRAVYTQRELWYPVEAVMNRAFTTGADSVYALQQLVDWVNAKYRAGWTTDRLEDKPREQVAEALVAITRQYVHEGGLEREVDEVLERLGARPSDELIEWAQKRFGRALDKAELENSDRDVREVLLDAGRQMARWELTQLERYVLLRIYDQGWKDHLLEMDHLKFAIMQRPMGGDQTHPQSQYAIEGRDLFNQMWKIIRGRVTDLIFKVGAGGDGETEARPAPARMELRHEESTNLGFAGADQEAAMRAQGEETRTATIRRAEPKVGRNDPCPCGSGKKYKQCHGKPR